MPSGPLLLPPTQPLFLARDYPEVCLDKGRSNDIPVHGYLLHLRHGIYLHSVIIIAQHSSMEWVDKVLAHSS